ncbi:hypothetical protein BGZ54_002309 [Gamsiella multidivaricata]|nr:hypothetical protein BGZ54_002309 [Gamsiella multidivaricata]
MTTVGTLSTDLGPAANDDKSDKLAAASIDGTGSMNYLQACSKLDMEPNPFEQSFSGTTTTGSAEASAGETSKPVLPPIASMSGRLASGSDQYGWTEPSLRMGPLSPSMLEGPQDPIMFEKPTGETLPIGSYPATTAPVSTIFTSGVPIAESGYPFAISGAQSIPPPAGPIQTAEPYPSVMYNQQQPMSQSSGPHDVPANRPSQPFPHGNGQAPMNDRYMPPQGAPHPENAGGYGNLHLLSQAQATHREMWIKRESIDANGHLQHNQGPHYHPHHPQQHQQHPQSTQHGQNMSGMPGMVSAQQASKHSAEPSFMRGGQRNRMTSEDNSDDSEMSKQSANSNERSSRKRSSVSDDKMDDEEKRKNFLERNRQAALKCRQRKKQWLSNLQAKVEYLTTDNEHLQTQTATLRDEIIHLKALLLAHKDCPVAQANGVYADTISGPNHSHNGMVSHGRGPAHAMQGPSSGQPSQQQQQQQQRGAGSRKALPAQMQTGGARMSMSSTAATAGPVGQASVRY